MNINHAEYSFEQYNHQGKDVILIRFPYDKSKIETVKSLKARWSTSLKCWYVIDSPRMRSLFNIEEPLAGKAVLLRIADVNKPSLQRLKEQIQLKGYSASTLKTYTIEFAQLLYELKNVDVNKLTPEKLRSYCLYCIDKLKISESQMHSRINAIRFYFEEVLGHKNYFTTIPRPKKPSTLPKVLSTHDIQKLFDAATNPKHKLMLQLCYGMGLRVSEVVGLKLSDIDSRRMSVHIEGAKGKKDRYVNLPKNVLDLLRSYYKQYKPVKYLFEGQYGGAYSIRSVQSVFKQAMNKARIKKPIGIHSLRHSYATHLHEYGTDIALIQKLLGHNNIKTTLKYTKVSRKNLQKVESPLDRM